MERSTKSKRRGRRVIVAVVTFALAATIGAVAQFVVHNIPQGPGNAYGAGATTQTITGVAITTQEGSGAAAIGPSETGAVKLYAHNDNAYPVTLTRVAQDPATLVHAVNTTCTTPAGSLTLATWTGSATIPAGGNMQLVPNLPVTTTAAFDICMSDQLFAVPVLLNGTAP